MFRITREERAVGDRLRREIGGSRPALSEGLHARLCRALQQHRAGGSPAPIRKATASRLSRWAAVAAATCLLAAVCATWQAMHAVRRDAGLHAPALASGRTTGMGRMVELAGRAAAKTDAMVDAAMEAQHWAYLDKDARSVLKMPAARLPFDVISSLLSVQRQERVRGPSSRPASRFENGVNQEQPGVRDG